MKEFEDEIDKIRIELFEETKGMDKKDIIKNVNIHAKKIALEYGIKIEQNVNMEYMQTINV